MKFFAECLTKFIYFFQKISLSDYYKKQDQNILFTSYPCSGATWLENCFIELGIRLDDIPNVLFKYKKPYNDTHSEYELLPSADHSKVGLPSLTFKKNFYFRNNVFCHFLSHSIPSYKVAKKFKTIVLIRDPRDTIWSEYNFSQNTSFEEFAKFRSTRWKAFYQQCLSLPNTDFFRFEDYKMDSVDHLVKILKFCEIDYDLKEVRRAILNSTFEKSREAERIYISETPENKLYFKSPFNRSGKVDQWKELSEYKETFFYIQETTKELLKLFNYPLM